MSTSGPETSSPSAGVSSTSGSVADTAGTGSRGTIHGDCFIRPLRTQTSQPGETTPAA
jgi:hypothetical protein